MWWRKMKPKDEVRFVGGEVRIVFGGPDRKGRGRVGFEWTPETKVEFGEAAHRYQTERPIRTTCVKGDGSEYV